MLRQQRTEPANPGGCEKPRTYKTGPRYAYWLLLAEGRLAQSEALRFSDLRRVAGVILTPIVPVYRRHFHPGQLQFITTSAYRRAKLFESDRFRQDFVEVVHQLRQQTAFRLIGWVLMPEHFHLLIKPEPAESTSRFMQELKKRTAQRIVSALCENRQHPWCRAMLARRR